MMAPDPSDEWDEWGCDTYEEWLKFFSLDYSSWYSVPAPQTCGVSGSVTDLKSFLEGLVEDCGGRAIWGAAESAPSAEPVRIRTVCTGMSPTDSKFHPSIVN